MEEFECFDDGEDFWGVTLDGEPLDNEECARYVKGVQRRVLALESALILITNANNNWGMSLEDKDEAAISEMIMQAILRE